MTSASENLKNVAVSDFMTRKVKVITENETMRQACKLMYQHNIGSIIIVKNDDSKSSDATKKEIPIGILTERDIASRQYPMTYNLSLFFKKCIS
jgi:CBS domain-containing protein